jgi:hypothetical protein
MDRARPSPCSPSVAASRRSACARAGALLRCRRPPRRCRGAGPPRSRPSTHDWELHVSAPLRLTSTVEGEDAAGGAFDPGAPPPLGLAEIRAAIPKHCWVKDPSRSMSYELRDVVLGLAAAAAARLHTAGCSGDQRTERGQKKSKIWGRGREVDVAWWDPRVGKENRETAGANCVLG